MAQFLPGDVSYSVAEAFDLDPADIKTQEFLKALTNRIGLELVEWSGYQCELVVDWLRTVHGLGYDSALFALREKWSVPQNEEDFSLSSIRPIQPPPHYPCTPQGVYELVKNHGPQRVEWIADRTQSSEFDVRGVLVKLQRSRLMLKRCQFYFLGDVYKWRRIDRDVCRVWVCLLLLRSRECDVSLSRLGLAVGLQPERCGSAVRKLQERDMVTVKYGVVVSIKQDPADDVTPDWKGVA